MPSPCTNRLKGCWWLLVAFILMSGRDAEAQEPETARRYLDTLCAHYMGGRGYVDQGALRAARFIASEMERIGLRPVFGDTVANNYIQPFALDVNTFPGKAALTIGGQQLRAGYDYITAPESAGANDQHYALVRVDSGLYHDQEALRQFIRKTDFEGKAVVLNRRHVPSYRDNEQWAFLHANRMNAAAVIILERKLTWGVGREVLPYPVLHVLEQKIPPEADSMHLDLEQAFREDYPTQNVAGMIPASGKKADSFLLVTAHYDHLGKLGDSAFFVGANDNASGVAMMLDLAQHFANLENALRSYHLVFVAFGAEEAGLVGSHHFIENTPFPLRNIAFVLNLDLMATGEGGLMVVNGKPQPGHMARLQRLHRQHGLLSQIRSRPNAPNSDHFFFTQKGVPAFFWYLMGTYPYYHDVHDTPKKPGLAGYRSSFELARYFLEGFTEYTR